MKDFISLIRRLLSPIFLDNLLCHETPFVENRDFCLLSTLLLFNNPVKLSNLFGCTSILSLIMDSSGDEVEKSGPTTLRLPRINLVASLTSEYHQIVDNPKRLPFFFHPIISRDREFTISGKRSYFTPSFYLKDHVNVPRRVYLNFETNNLAFGATSGLLMGLATQHYTQTYARFAALMSTTWLQRLDPGIANGIRRTAFGTIITSRIAKRALVGAVVFDMLKRTLEMERGRNDFANATFAGFLTGAAFGLRGGFHTGVLGAFALGSTATLAHLFMAED